MSNNWRRYEVLLPLQFNDGRPDRLFAMINRVHSSQREVVLT